MDSQVGHHETSDSRPSLESGKKPQMQLSKEELNILRECNRESFYFRCLPFALIGMGATYYGVKTGHLSSHPKFGPAIKMTAAAFTGWLLGKFSYRQKCEEKFLTLENSTIGNAVRRKRGYVLKESDSEKGQFFSDDDSDLKDSNYTSSGDFHSSSGSLNFDRNEASLELDDRNRPTIDSGRNLSDESEQDRQYTTYEELRRKNRIEFEKQQYRQPGVPRSDTFRQPWNSSSSEPLRRTNSDFQEDTPHSPKNTYGDAWDNPKFS